MKGPSLDALYAQLDKDIRLVESYTEINDLSFIIRACRLKPHTYIFSQKSEKITLYRWWFDEFGNSLRLLDKNTKLIYNDLSLPRKDIICTDLYYGLSIDRVAKISKLSHITFGKDDDLQQNCAIVTFLGIDNYFRSFMYVYGEWQRVAPLLLGISALQAISQNKDIKYFKKLDNLENSPIPCVDPEQWLTFMPPRKEFMSLLAVHCQPVFSILNFQ